MSISRRKFLLTSALLNAAGYSTSAYACFYGFSFYFAPVPSSDFIVSSKDERSLGGFFDKKYGPNRWRYSSPSSFVRAPDIAENAAVVPVTIRLDDVEQVRKYQKIEVFMERIVDVLDAAKFDSTYLPPVYHVDGENWESKNHPNALQLRKITYPMSTMFNAVGFKLGEYTLPEISIRLRNLDSRKMRVVTAFIPSDASQQIVVVKQENVTETPGCSTTIYVNGKWPDGLKSVYEYQPN